MRRPKNGARRAEQSIRTARRAVCGMLLLTGTMTACVQDDDSSQQHVLSAAQVCDDVLSPTGRKALELVSGTERFTELTRRNEAGDPERFSVALAAEKLRGKSGDRADCTVYRADDESGHPQVSIEFEPRASRPETLVDREQISFDLGVHAYVNDDGGTYLYFACTTEGLQGKKSYVKASMFTVQGVAPGSAPEDRMAILNDVSRALAEQLGCADEAALPARVPEPVKG
ncbi:hypothetical protein [Streptomyces californicus]|uniref:hypothetical protein n=1 Tax=Streptomyces californicus TaxID=67351 RepID=UPI0033E5D69F